MIALALLVSAAEPDMLQRATLRLAPERPCAVVTVAEEITVCGRRRADRFRVPLVVHGPGDPRHEDAWTERTRLIRRTTPIEALSPFLVGGGMAGASATINASGTRVAAPRPLAP